MKIELKNIKYSASLSEETNNYKASLYVDGTKIGEVQNAGHGGPDMFHGDHEAYEKAQNWVRANMPPLDNEYGDPLEMDIELLCDELLSDWIMKKKLTTVLRSKVLFQKPGDKQLYEMSFKGVRKIQDTHIAAVKKKHPGATILNTMPIEEAIKLFRQVA